MTHWLLLIVAIGFEIFATSMLKSTHGFTRMLPTLMCLTSYAIAFAALAHAVKTIPVGITYALWSGLGTLSIVVIGSIFLDEPLTIVKIVGIGLIILGVVVLNIGGEM